MNTQNVEKKTSRKVKMKNIMIISLNSGGTMGHGKIITSLANFLSQKKKHVTILSDMHFSKNFNINNKVKIKNLKKIPHINYTIGVCANATKKTKFMNLLKRTTLNVLSFLHFLI
ncbi:hypothetical protein COY00_03135 [Candidatus Pacearchaeota archaeon CG_4_10_14_0_2_um_filter_35_33]|nr:MAG: hypothetical protein COY00_03135 [Candidatus Pacearchaeota archaeon CG_4_10_14_0_2_um_filter_35_33]PJA69819.1 MAG: hypothetical protein CO155_03040 [Candidatus Pacearchaeota archaeon CG_4_9_14_3_um_filter_35_19]